MLPTPQDFVQEMRGKTPSSATGVGSAGSAGSAGGLSNEFRALIVQYCAHCLAAEELSQVPWGPLGKRLGCKPEFLREAAEALGESLWSDVLMERIKRAAAAKEFKDSTWERLESIAVNKLITLAEKGLIRDPGELLAVASTARRAVAPEKTNPPAGGQHMNVNLNIGGQTADDGTLPAAGTTMTIDLSPRTAESLKKAKQRAEKERVIDGEMISAKELRSLLEKEQMEKAAEKAEVEDAVVIDSTEGSNE
jgi:hypothetical protein